MSYRRHDALDKKGAEYWHPIEVSNNEEIIALQEKKLQQQMAYLAKNSALYQQKFAVCIKLPQPAILCKCKPHRAPQVVRRMLP